MASTPEIPPKEGFSHRTLERNVTLLGLLSLVAVAIGGIVEIAPLFWVESTIEKVSGVRPYTPLELAGRNIYIREGCYNCHSQMVRPFRDENERYGHYSLAAESMYDRPFQWGSKRTGPDLARVGGRYSDEWHRIHLLNPRDLVPESNMFAYPWLDTPLDAAIIPKKMQALRTMGAHYSDADIAGALEEVKGKSELDALIAYLQVLGTAIRAGGK